MICDHCRANVAYDAAQDLSDLFLVSSQGDDTRDLDTRWDQPLLSSSEIPNENILEGLHRMKIRDSVQLQTVLAIYDPIRVSIPILACSAPQSSSVRPRTSFLQMWKEACGIESRTGKERSSYN